MLELGVNLIMINSRKLLEFFGKSFCIIGPLAWGAFTWAMAFGGLSYYIIPFCAVSYQINLLIRAIIGTLFICIFFGSSLQQATKQYIPTVFGFRVLIPTWWQLISVVFLAISLSFFVTPLWEYPIINSLVLGILISSFFEELVTRSSFVKYSMSLFEFIIFNILSSIAFSFMHIGYEQCLHFNFIEQIYIHGLFSFFMGILVYKTRRIEITMMLHAFSNLPYLFKLGLGESYYVYISYFSHFIHYLLIPFCIIWCCAKKIRKPSIINLLAQKR